MPRSDKLSGYKTKIKTIGNATCITYHTTEIVKFNPDTIILNFGDWDSVTTRRKMNQASRQFGLGYVVVRHKGVTYIHFCDEALQYCGYEIVINRDTDGFNHV